MVLPKRKFRARRRTFLKGIALSGGAAALTGRADIVLAESEPPEKADRPDAAGYQLTAHIREYYKKARF